MDARKALDKERMTFEDAARLDPDVMGGELDAGRFVPVTKNTWQHGVIAGNASSLHSCVVAFTAATGGRCSSSIRSLSPPLMT